MDGMMTQTEAPGNVARLDLHGFADTVASVIAGLLADIDAKVAGRENLHAWARLSREQRERYMFEARVIVAARMGRR